jgi:hypothetical protein
MPIQNWRPPDEKTKDAASLPNLLLTGIFSQISSGVAWHTPTGPLSGKKGRTTGLKACLNEIEFAQDIVFEAAYWLKGSCVRRIRFRFSSHLAYINVVFYSILGRV